MRKDGVVEASDDGQRAVIRGSIPAHVTEERKRQSVRIKVWATSPDAVERAVERALTEAQVPDLDHVVVAPGGDLADKATVAAIWARLTRLRDAGKIVKAGLADLPLARVKEVLADGAAGLKYLQIGTEAYKDEELEEVYALAGVHDFEVITHGASQAEGVCGAKSDVVTKHLAADGLVLDWAARLVIILDCRSVLASLSFLIHGVRGPENAQ